MSGAKTSVLTEVLGKHRDGIMEDWLRALAASGANGRGLASDLELREQCREFIDLLQAALKSGDVSDSGSAWRPIRQMVAGIAKSRAVQGFTPTETASFVLSFKDPFFARLRSECDADAGALFEAISTVGLLLDRLVLLTTESFQAGREEIIIRQQNEMLELSTPVVTLWEGILALPMIGTLDSARTQVVMEALLQRIVDTGCSIAILDITGVPTVDTLVAQHLLKTVAAARLMGADCIISGIRPQIAQTIVHLGVDLSAVVTKASLSDAFALALQRTGLTVTRARGGATDSAAADVDWRP